MHRRHFPTFYPERSFIYGKATRFRLLRSAALFAAMATLGFALTQFANANVWRVFGLGLMLPAGGFMPSSEWHCLITFGLALATFSASLLLWFATGNALAPPLIWLGLAILAVAIRQKPVPDGAGLTALGVILAIALAILLRLAWQKFGGQRWRKSANRELAQYLNKTSLVLSVPSNTAEEFSERELKLMRFLLDRALQPLENFDGFEWLDQFQTAAIRYQLHFAGYALAMAQASRLPALHGYLDDAQRCLIEKQRNHRVWRYWALENAWGHLARSPDPIAKANIMFSGFTATQMAVFQAASGARDYLAPSSFALEHPDGQRFAYDFPAIIDVLFDQFSNNRFGLLACEPNWIYPLCNTITLAAIKAADAQLGGTRWPALANRIRQALEEEFIDPFGRFVPCRSAYTGLALPILGGAMPQAMTCFFLNATLPDIAARQWLMLRNRMLNRQSPRHTLLRQAFWPVDTGNYRFSRAASLSASALAAVEMGDREIADLCLHALDTECPAISQDGRSFRPNASIWAHAVEMMALSAQPHSFRHLIETPRSSDNGPVIADLNYPDVLVAKAVHDSKGLQATLYPGSGVARQGIVLGGLQPGARYHSKGCEEELIHASPEGRAELHVHLDGRKEIRVLQAN